MLMKRFNQHWKPSTLRFRLFSEQPWVFHLSRVRTDTDLRVCWHPHTVRNPVQPDPRGVLEPSNPEE